MESLQERKRNQRVKELMSKKTYQPLIVLEDTKVKEWNVKQTLSQQIDQIVDYNQSLKQERREHWQKLSQQYI